MSVRNTLVTLLFGGMVGFLLLREQEHQTLEPFDRVHREFLKANPADGRAPAPSDPFVVFGRLDDRDQSRPVFAQWPLGAEDWQIILENLSGYAPKAVAVGAPLLFPKAPPRLEAAARNVPRLTVGADASAGPASGEPDALPDELPALKVIGSPAAIPEFRQITAPPVPGAAGVREIDLIKKSGRVSVDGDWCRVPMVARSGERVVPMLALRALLAWADIPLTEVTVQPGVAITAGKSMRIEIDDAGFFRFYLSLAPEVPALNADTFVLTKDQAMKEHPAPDPRGRTISQLPSSLLWIAHDNTPEKLLRLPNGTPVSASDLTVRAIAAIQTGSYMRPLAPADRWIAPAATLLFCLWLTNWRKSRLLPGALFAAATLGGVSLWFYRQDHTWIPLAPALGVLGSTFILSFILPAPVKRSEVPPPEKSESRRSRTASRPVPGSVPAPAPAPAPADEVPAEGKSESKPDFIVAEGVVVIDPPASEDLTATAAPAGELPPPESESSSDPDPAAKGDPEPDKSTEPRGNKKRRRR